MGHNGDVTQGRKRSKAEDKRHLMNKQDPLPNYDSGIGTGDAGGQVSKKEEKVPRIATLQLVSKAEFIVSLLSQKFCYKIYTEYEKSVNGFYMSLVLLHTQLL